MEIKIVWNSDKYRHAFIKYITKSLYSKKLVDKISHTINNYLATDTIDNLAAISAIKEIINKAQLGRKNGAGETRTRERLRILNKFIKRPIRTYCDIGCGDGRLTNNICKELGNPYTIGIDMYPVNDSIGPIQIINGQLIGKVGNIHYAQNTSLEGINIKFDLITSFMTLHHIEPQYLLQTLLFARNALDADGILLIREHDCTSKKSDKKIDDEFEALNSFLDLIHLYNNDTSFCQFRSANEWVTLMSKVGFKLHKIIFYDEPNPQRIFHASFVKVK
jgi:2-polyprenyl-3-methyl-5-hydroxy-6-metoxy-1,4-benzoquinol methylase